MLYIIGLGLSSIEDISFAALNAIKTCDHVFIDTYTSILTHGIERLSEFCGKDVKSADREFTEQNPMMISLAKSMNVAFLVVGDPLGATTHSGTATLYSERQTLLFVRLRKEFLTKCSTTHQL